uniref:Uncharacterized protein n=1 Tax=Oryza glumipatula TaxID=40148 RepID=A0A0E0A5L1_9ORYZ
MADRAIHYLLRATSQKRRHQALAVGVGRHRRRLLLLDSGRVLMLLAVVILVHLLTPGAAVQGAEPWVLLAAFLLWLLGAAFAVLSLAAGQFPVLAATIAAAT